MEAATTAVCLRVPLPSFLSHFAARMPLSLRRSSLAAVVREPHLTVHPHLGVRASHMPRTGHWPLSLLYWFAAVCTAASLEAAPSEPLPARRASAKAARWRLSSTPSALAAAISETSAGLVCAVRAPSRLQAGRGNFCRIATLDEAEAVAQRTAAKNRRDGRVLCSAGMLVIAGAPCFCECICWYAYI